MLNLILLCIVLVTLSMAVAKRICALTRSFALQSLFLALFAAVHALHGRSLELWIVAILVLGIKALLIPFLLRRICARIRVDENIGFFVNPLLSLALMVLFGWLSYLFVGRLMAVHDRQLAVALSVALTVFLAGFLLMSGRMKALTQVIGLLVMENGLFLAAAAITGGMPFFVEIAIFFDVFVCVLIMEIFVYKINRLFTHIDADKLTGLRG